MIDTLAELLSKTFDREFNYCWKNISKEFPDRITRVKRNFAFEISGRAYGYCLASFIDRGMTPPTVYDTVRFVFEYHYLNVRTLSDAQRARLQSDEEYKEKAVREIVKIFERRAREPKLSPIATPYNPEVYTARFLADFYLSTVLNMELPEGIDKNDAYRFDVLRKMLINAFSIIKSIIVQSFSALPHETITSWRSLFELEYKIMALMRFNHTLTKIYMRFGEYCSPSEDISEPLKDEFGEYAKKYNKSTRNIEFRNYGWLLATDKSLKPSLKTLLQVAKPGSPDIERYDSFKASSHFVHSDAVSVFADEKGIYYFITCELYDDFKNLSTSLRNFSNQYNITLDESWQDEESDLVSSYRAARDGYYENYLNERKSTK